MYVACDYWEENSHASSQFKRGTDNEAYLVLAAFMIEFEASYLVGAYRLAACGLKGRSESVEATPIVSRFRYSPEIQSSNRSPREETKWC